MAPLFKGNAAESYKPKHLFDNKDNTRFAILANKNLATPTQKSTRKFEETNYDEEYE